MRTLLLLAVCIFSLTSCQTFYTTDSAGVATISPNQFKLPPEIGVLKREYINTFDGRGYNVGAGYNYYSPTQKTALTVFVVSRVDSRSPSSQEQQQYFNASRYEVFSVHKNSKEIRQASMKGHNSSGKFSEFRYNSVFARTPQEVASFLAVFRDGNRLVKYRITGPVSDRDVIYSNLTEAVQTLTKIN